MGELMPSIPLVIHGLKLQYQTKRRNRSRQHLVSIRSSSKKTTEPIVTNPQAILPKSYQPTIDTDNLKDEDHQEQLSHRCLDIAER